MIRLMKRPIKGINSMFAQNRINPAREVYVNKTYQDQGGTVHERNFFNRTIIQQKIEACFGNKSTPLALVKGARRSGKSSLILRLANHLCYGPNSSYVHARITLGEAIGITSAVRFATRIIIAVAHAFDQPMPAGIESLTTLSAEEFLKGLKQITAMHPQKMVLLTIDEIEALLDSIETTQEKIAVAGLIRALIEAASSVDNPLPFRYLFTTVATQRNLSFPPNSFKEFYLEPFSESDFDELIDWLCGANAIELSTEDRLRCHELTGRWPFYLHWLCQEASFRKIDISKGWPDRTIQVVVADRSFPTSYLGYTITKTYNDLDNIQAKALLLILTKQEVLTKADLLELGAEYLIAAKELSDCGYFSGSEEFGYSYRLEIFRTYLQKLEVFKNEYKFLRSQLHLSTLE